MPSHALLLRLFLSPSFFSVHVALRYLLSYADNIGITYYLTSRLKQLDTRELREVWGFICHLLVTRPSKSRALECFVVEIAQRSTHIAMTTLWFMQAALHDVSIRGPHSPSFAICQRVLHTCHEIIFSDLPPPTTGPYGGLTLQIHSRFGRRKVKHHPEPAMVGMGLVLAGAPGWPRLTKVMGEVAVEQGRADENTHDYKSIESQEDDIVLGLRLSQRYSRQVAVEEDEDNDDNPESDDTDTTSTVQLGDPPKPAAIVGRRLIGPAQTVPALPLHLHDIQRSPASEDPLGQNDMDHVAPPYLSTPSISSTRPTPRTATLNRADALLGAYDTESQSQLLRSHYCRSEVQFILSLENICNRLLVIPRPARKHSQPHHRIVRIPPGESVVLNSAERAPYLLYIEILNDDLDFQPTKRANKELLKKIVTKENNLQGKSNELNPFQNIRTARPLLEPSTASGVLVENSTPLIHSEMVLSPTAVVDDDEEIDLVEQVYGADQPLRAQTVDLSESIVLPPAPKNKELDMVAWSRPSSQTPSIPAVDAFPTYITTPPSLSWTPSQSSHHSSHESSPNSPNAPNRADSTSVLSLDDYSERMRTAAIMLAQLNTSLMREQANGSHPGTGSTQQRPGSSPVSSFPSTISTSDQRTKVLQYTEAAAIRDRIMKEMIALEEQRMQRMRENWEDDGMMRLDISGGSQSAEDETIIRRELNKVDPSAVVFSESWAAKKSRIRHGSPYGHLANWDCVSVIVKTGDDLRQEQLAVQLIHEFQQIWEEEKCPCWVRYFRIVITGGTSGLVETVTDAVSIHSIKKAEYARRIAEGRFGHVTLLDHFKSVKDRHNGNILLDREGHLIHIDFGFILSNTPGNIGFEAAPFKLPFEYIEVLGGVTGAAYLEFRRLFKEGFEAVRKHCDRIITLVELMQKDSTLPCFAAFGEQTSVQLRERFQPVLTHSLVGSHVDRLIDTSLGSHWTRLYDSFQYYSQSIL
ncbi:hypothetical protein C0993_010002 [Termitomyces sp. T159_Od127]|nr:hypothetical protein C0993_010002 [Termitomyces sp. T159_Od127]